MFTRFKAALSRGALPLRLAAAFALALAVLLVGLPYSGPVLSAVSAGKRKLPVYSVERGDNKVSISFDAAWGADDTPKLLKILSDYNIKATFFLCGYWVQKYPDMVREIYAQGHDIGNHGDTHAHGKQLGLEGNRKEILGAHNKIKDIIGADITLFRPPYGEYNNTVIEAAESLGYQAVQWDVDSHDWMKKGLDYEINQVLNHKNLRPGSIILFHNDARDTPEALPVILDGLLAKGYEIVPISQLIYEDDFTIDHTGRQKPKGGAGGQ